MEQRNIDNKPFYFLQGPSAPRVQGLKLCPGEAEPPEPIFSWHHHTELSWCLFLNISLFSKHTKCGFLVPWLHVFLLQAPPVTSCPVTHASVVLFFVSSLQRADPEPL